jgi:voltage-gated potassium channel
MTYFFILFGKFRKATHQRWLVTLVFFASVFCYASTGFMYFELDERPDFEWHNAIWWSFVTMTTVGYGDWAPITPHGQFLVGLPTMLVGVSVLGYILSLLASLILETKIKELKGMTKINQSGHIIISRFNTLVSTLKIVDEIRMDLSTANTHIVIIDEDLEELPTELHENNVSFSKGSASRDKILEQANFMEATHLLIRANEQDLSNSDSSNLAIALTVEKLKPEIITVVECVYPENIAIFERAGCDSVVCIASLNYQMIVQELQDPGTHSVCTELTSNTHGMQFYIVNPPPEATNYGKIYNHYAGLNDLVLGLRRGMNNIMFPNEAEPIRHGDKVILIGKDRPV